MTLVQGALVPKTFKDIWERASKIRNFFPEADGRLLWDCANEMHPIARFTHAFFLEVGSYHGCSTVVLGSMGWPVIVVEPSYLQYDPLKDGNWDGTSGWGFRYERNQSDLESRKVLVENLRDLPCILMPIPSKDVELGALPLALVHIDGNHTIGGIDVDCERFLPNLISGGIAAFHDYDVPDYPAVKQEVDEWCSGWEKVGRGESLTAFRKP